MSTFLFQLGHCPELSFAEIVSLSHRSTHPVNILRHDDQAAWLEMQAEDIPHFCQQLGGTIRACEVLIQRPDIKDYSPAGIISLLKDAKIIDRMCEKAERPMFGLSLLGDWSVLGGKQKQQGWLHEIASVLKDQLKELGISSRFVLPDTKHGPLELNSAQVDKNNLLSKGLECVLCKNGNNVTITITRWLQPYETYSQRDYGRPRRDAKQGMLPPKLARMLINLASTSETKTILDPFCGNGGLITEACLMGFKATGLDNQQKNIQSCKENWQWLQSKHQNSLNEIQVLQGDARQLHTHFSPLYFDACVTEPYLGPPISKPITHQRFKKVSSELTDLYVRVLGEIRSVVKPGAGVVFIVPRFRLADKNNPESLPIMPDIKLMGYTLLDAMSGFTPTNSRKTLIYARPNQVVQREIFILQA